MRRASLALLGLLLASTLLGLAALDLGPPDVAKVLALLRGAWWAPPAVAALFVGLAFVGAPQVVLIAATVAVFGALEGAVLSWAATLISAWVGFAFGRWTGAEALQRRGGGVARRALAFLQRHGAASAFLVRLVPTGPFVLVNMALGASGLRLRDFLGGTAAGVLPKITLIAGVGHGFAALASGRTALAVWLLIGLAAAIVALGWWLKPRLQGWRGDAAK